MDSKTFGNIFKGDKVIWMIFFFLCIISIVEVFSASSELTYKGGSYFSPLIKHIGILIFGFISMVVVLNLQCKYFKIATPFFIILSVFTLLWVIVAGQSTNGAQRWVNFVGIQFQPSEIAKGTVVLATAQILSALQTDHGADKIAFKYILGICFLIIPLIALENLSTAALLSLVVLMMMLIGRVPMRQIGKLVGVVVLGMLLVFAGVMLVGKDTQNEDNDKVLTEQTQTDSREEGLFVKIFHRADTWKSRIDKFANHKEIAPQDVDLDKDAQVAHANIIEELGIEGAVFVAGLYIMLLFRTGRIASRCENYFPALLAMGLALLLVTQALFNMCVAVGIVPVTGQPLPLISKGGTSSVINCIYVGVILSVSRSAKKRGESEPVKAKVS